MKNIYPITIIKDRYNGAYSHGQWTAWPLDIYQIPWAQDSSDSDCANFWDGYDKPVGKGDTPNEALEDLEKQLGKVTGQ